jgi:acyl-coenzyme A synthetase/AMP-(fatty) acid ligase/acyl carrier protein
MTTTYEQHLQQQASCYPSGGRAAPWDFENSPMTIPERITELAQLQPDTPAVIGPDEVFSFDKLNQIANGIAAVLNDRLGPDRVAVPVLLRQEPLAIAAALGVLRAGKIFVGLDVYLSARRNQSTLDQLDSPLLMTAVSDNNLLSSAGVAARNPVDAREIVPKKEAPDVQLDLDAPAIINFTSGTTGPSKGVVQPHRSARDQYLNFTGSYHAGPAVCMVSSGTLAWAGPCWDIFGSLCRGSRVTALDVRRLGWDRLADLLVAIEPTIVIPDTVIRQLVKLRPDLRLPSVRLLSIGGDTVFRSQIEALWRTFPNAQLSTGLGLSEAGRVTELLLAPSTPLNEPVLPIGFPAAGIQVDLVDAHGQRVPPGEVGEIKVISSRLAQGYFRRPDLTAEKFSGPPKDSTLRSYLTSDLGQRRDDGQLVHLGRKDFQVKVNGLPVHTNEVEGLILNAQGVAEASVVLHRPQQGSPYLVAFVVPQFPVPNLLSLRQSLAKQLADHQVPSGIMLVPELPKTPTGKVDRQALPEPNRARFDLSSLYEAPSHPDEAQLVAIWEEVFERNEIGIHDNFLELGGDSLLFIRLLNRIPRDFGIQIRRSDVIDADTIAVFVERLRQLIRRKSEL